MSYKALYRSYRPTTFNEVVGQKHVIRTIKNALIENKISHAYLLSGSRGTGKTTIARILAKAVNCDNLVNGEPCNQCPSCLTIVNDETTDIVELDAASNNGVEEMRNILERVNFLPSVLRKKVYIIDETHMLSTSAFNALLKTLEEPPAHIVFIFATTEPYKVPATILSRCQRFDFKPLTSNEIVNMLGSVCLKEKIVINNEALKAIAEVAEGGMRDALSILDQARVYTSDEITNDDINSITGRISNQKLIEFLSLLNEREGTKAIALITNLIDNGKEIGKTVGAIIEFCRDLLLYKNGTTLDQEKNLFSNDSFQQLAEITDSKELFYYIDIMVDVTNKIKYTNSPKIYLEVAIMKIVNSIAKDLDVLERITILEANTNNITIDGAAPNDSRMGALDGKIKKINNEIASLDIYNFKDMVNVKLNLLEDLMASTNTASQEFNNKLTDIQEQINNLSLHHPLSDENITNKEINLTDLQEQVNELIEQKITPLTKTISESYENRLAKLEEQDAILGNTVSEMLSLYNKESENVLAENKKEAVIFDNSENEARMNILSQEIADIKEKIEYNTYANYQTMLNSYNESSSSNEEVNELRTNFVTIVANIQELMARIERMENNDSSASVVELSQILEQSNKQLENTQLIIENIKTKIQGIENNYLTKESATIDNILIEMAELKKKDEMIINIENKQATLQGDYLKITEKLKDLNNKLDGMPVKRKSPYEITPLDEPLAQANNDKQQVDISNDKSQTSYKDDTVITKKEGREIRSNERTVVIKQSVPRNPLPETIDETAKVYDVRIIERILHQSRENNCRSEKTGLIEKWSQMTNKSGTLLLPIAKLLQDGKLVANGNQEILIIYSQSSICNHLMEPKNHNSAKQILKVTFGKDYDFMALPENTWQQKRQEYSGQYGMGIKYPKLSPINNPELKVFGIVNNHYENTRNQPLRQAEEFFGKDIVEIEEE